MLVLWLACARSTPLDGKVVESAQLTDPKWAELDAVVGMLEGSADLDVVTTDGEAISMPVHLGGVLLGASVGADGPIIWSDIPLDLPGPTDGSDVLGRYHGSVGGLTAGIGFQTLKLTNSAGVTWGWFGLTVGAGVRASSLWMGIRATDGDETDEELPDETDV
jgi:hypothetical protein